MDRIKELARCLMEECPKLPLRMEEPMARHTSFRIGGPVALMALPESRAQAAAAVRCASCLGIEPFFLGNGSNLLVTDGPLDRFLIKTTGLRRYSRRGDCLSADGGLTMAALASAARRQGLAGLEFAHGIPGTLGGAVTMNAGAYGGEMAQVVRSVTLLGADGKVERTERFEFGYRRSAFSDGKRMILGAELELTPDDPDAIAGRMEELAARRREKQPLDRPSAGSMFKRPEGYFAAALIDQCGLKGLSVGGAQVSEKHAGFVINRGGATCADVLALVEEIRRRVLAETGVLLEMEVKVLD